MFHVRTQSDATKKLPRAPCAYTTYSYCSFSQRSSSETATMFILCAACALMVSTTSYTPQLKFNYLQIFPFLLWGLITRLKS